MTKSRSIRIKDFREFGKGIFSTILLFTLFYGNISFIATKTISDILSFQKILFVVERIIISIICLYYGTVSIKYAFSQFTEEGVKEDNIFDYINNNFIKK